MRALALHQDVLLVTSALLQVNCVIVRGGVADEGGDRGDEILRVVEHDPAEQRSAPSGETFVIDSPVLPDELDALPALIEQARFPAPSGLLATHGDWDHLLARLAFPEAALGVAESTAERLAAAPGEAQRDLRTFDEELLIERARPLALGSLQTLPVPGRCELGDHELELHATGGHTADGMALVIGWAGVLVAGDYISSVEIPSLSPAADGRIRDYLETLQRLRALIATVERVVPGHGPVMDRDQAQAVLDEDLAYMGALLEVGDEAQMPRGGRSARQRSVHLENAKALDSG